jgi:hypothetical protein
MEGRSMNDVDFYGVYLTPLLVALVVALLIGLVLRRLGQRLGLYRVVWHAPLFDAAAFVLIVSAIVTCYARLSL